MPVQVVEFKGGIGSEESHTRALVVPVKIGIIVGETCEDEVPVFWEVKVQIQIDILRLEVF